MMWVRSGQLGLRGERDRLVRRAEPGLMDTSNQIGGSGISNILVNTCE